VVTSSTSSAKSRRAAIWRRYVFAPAFGSHSNSKCVFEAFACAPLGSPIVRVKGCGDEYGPGTVPVVVFGKFARTRQWKSPVPVILIAVSAGMRSPLMFLCVPSGRSTETSYETAPSIGSHCHVGMKSPAAGLPALGTGAGSRFWNVPVADQVSPTRASSSARTRQ
jgi:hypothetical protein